MITSITERRTVDILHRTAAFYARKRLDTSVHILVYIRVRVDHNAKVRTQETRQA